MQLKQVLLLAASSGLASATALEPVPADRVRDVSPRQTTGNLFNDLFELANSIGLSACLPNALPLITALPEIPKGLIGQDLVSQAISQTTLRLDEVCKFSITGSVGSLWSSFFPTAASFMDAKSAEIASIVSKCPSASALSNTVVAYTKCSQWSGKFLTGSATSSKATVTGSSSSTSKATTGSSSSSRTTAAVSGTPSSSGFADASVTTSPSRAAAPRETGCIIAGAALAGAMAVVAAL